MTGETFGPILIYRKEDRVARADRAGAGFVDNSIALISRGKAGFVSTGAGYLGACVGSHPLPPPRTR